MFNNYDLSGECQINLGFVKFGSKSGGCGKPTASALRDIAAVAAVAAIVLSGPALVIAIAVVALASIAAVTVDPACNQTMTTQCYTDLATAGLAVVGPLGPRVAAILGKSKDFQIAVNIIVSGLSILATNDPNSEDEAYDYDYWSYYYGGWY